MKPMTSAARLPFAIVFVAVTLSVASGAGQAPSRVWSVGPLTKGEQVMGFAVSTSGETTLTGPHLDSQTSSIFTATRGVVFAGDRIVLISKGEMRQVPGHNNPAHVYKLLSLDLKTGEVKDTREITAFRDVPIFATNDAHFIVAGYTVLRLTPDLKDAGVFDYDADGHGFGSVESISPDGSTLGNATRPGYELIDAQTLKATQLTKKPAYATSVSSQGFVTDNVHWTGQYPNDLGFVTYTDPAGDHLLYHGSCGGRPQFLTNDLVLEPGCKSPLIIDTHGNVVKVLSVNGGFSFAGVSQNGERFALQHTVSGGHETFVIFSIKTGERIADVKPDRDGEAQSWTAFSPDGSMFVVGSPFKLALYSLP
jgi:hypothetical protein